MRLHFAVVAALLLLLPHRAGAQSDEREEPFVHAAFANAPGMITIAWHHLGNGVFGFVVQIREGSEWRDAQALDPSFGQTSLTFLEPDRTYALRVCAVYGPDREDDRECSEPEAQVRTMPAPSGGAWGTPPVITRREVTETTIAIWLQSGPRYGFFHVRWRAADGGGEQQDRIGSNGQGGGYHALGGLSRGRTYVFSLQGCNRTLFGSSCGSWSAPIEIRTALPPLETPQLTAEPGGVARWVVLRWQHGQDNLGINALLFRDGKLIYDALRDSGTGFQNPYTDSVPRENTAYAYRLCFIRDEWACSGDVLGMGKPVPPTAPIDVAAIVRRLFRGRFRGPLPPPMIEVTWRNTQTPGQYLAVQRLEARQSGGGPFGRLIIEWVEAARLEAKTDPTVAVLPVPDAGGRPTIGGGETYRVCALVPALGAAGTACSDSTDLR